MLILSNYFFVNIANSIIHNPLIKSNTILELNLFSTYIDNYIYLFMYNQSKNTLFTTYFIDNSIQLLFFIFYFLIISFIFLFIIDKKDNSITNSLNENYLYFFTPILYLLYKITQIYILSKTEYFYYNEYFALGYAIDMLVFLVVCILVNSSIISLSTLKNRSIFLIFCLIIY
jgi:hypothetical protein